MKLTTSGYGTKRTWLLRQTMSAMERITDSTLTSRYVRFVPETEVAAFAKGS